MTEIKMERFVKFVGNCALGGKRVCVYQSGENYRLRAETVGNNRIRITDEDGKIITLSDKHLDAAQYENFIDRVTVENNQAATAQRALEYMGYNGFRE